MDEIRVLPPEPTILPEERLFLAVLKRAILDYIEFRKTKDYEWFFSDDCKQICQWIDVSQSWIIRIIKNIK
jgi:hypothetical protein